MTQANSLGKGEVESSILSHSTIKPLQSIEKTPLPFLHDCAEPSENEPDGLARFWQGADMRLHLCLAPGFDSPTIFYRYFSGCGELLYVGVTNGFTRRLNQHCAKRWFAEAMFCRAEIFPTEYLAQKAESFAIFEEAPKHNIRRFPYSPHLGIRDDWHVKKMGGFIGEAPRWFDLSEPGSIYPTDTPDWWVEPKRPPT